MAYLAIAENPDGALVFQVGPTDDQSPARGLCAPVARRYAARGARRLGRRAQRTAARPVHW